MDEHGHFFHAEFTDMVCYSLLYWNHCTDDEAMCTLCLCQCCILRLFRYRMQCDKCLAHCSHLHLYGQRAQGNVRRVPPLREEGEGPRKIVKFWPNKRARLIPSTLRPIKGV